MMSLQLPNRERPAHCLEEQTDDVALLVERAALLTGPSFNRWLPQLASASDTVPQVGPTGTSSKSPSVKISFTKLVNHTFHSYPLATLLPHDDFYDDFDYDDDHSNIIQRHYIEKFLDRYRDHIETVLVMCGFCDKSFPYVFSTSIAKVDNAEIDLKTVADGVQALTEMGIRSTQQTAFTLRGEVWDSPASQTLLLGILVLVREIKSHNKEIVKGVLREGPSISSSIRDLIRVKERAGMMVGKESLAEALRMAENL